MQQVQVPTLKKCCIVSLIRCRRYLGDVGYLDVESLRELLFHCSVEELRSIEDMTLEGSNRDLSWYTWHYWLEHYRKKFGSPRAGVQAPPLRAQAPEDYTSPLETEAAADWRRAYFDRKEADAALVNRLGQQVKAMYQQAEADRQSKQAQVCVKVQGDRVRRRIATAVAGVKRPPPAYTPADKQKSKVLKSIGLSASSSSRAPAPGSKKATITRTVIPQPPRPTLQATPPLLPRLNPTTAARLASHSKAGTSTPLPPMSKPAPRPNPNPLSPSKPSPTPSTQRPLNLVAAPSPSPRSQPPNRPSHPLQQPLKTPKLSAPPTMGRPPTTTAGSIPAKGYRQPVDGRPPQGLPAGARAAQGASSKPGKSDLAQLSDAQLEAELARRRRLAVAPGLHIVDDDDY